MVTASLMAVSALFLVPANTVKNDATPSKQNTILPKKDGGALAEDNVMGRINQPRKTIDTEQPETRVIHANSQPKKAEQPKLHTESIHETSTKQTELKKSKMKSDAAAKASGTDSTKHSESTEPKTDNEDDKNAEGQSAAFNPETGEINWDCPCLGGMAHGPCGEEFKAAFSCFVYSETEPKGINCIEKFEGMRNCFRQHPEHYKEELYEDDEPVPSTDSNADATTSEPETSEKPKEATIDILKVA